MRSPFRLLPLLVATAALAVGCVTTKATPLGTGLIRPPVPEAQVAIYRNADQVRACYEEVALLTSSGDYSATDENAMFKSMRKKAGEVGANGVILDSLTEPTTGAKIAQAFLSTPAQRKGKAIAIYVLPPGATTETCPPPGAAAGREH